MKVGTDGVLLGAWADISNCQRILDIGSGTGLVTLQVAQRSSAQIDGVEIDKESAIESIENINRSNWSDRISIHNCSIDLFNPTDKYDHIVSNPPFFTSGNISPNSSRATARHNIDLNYPTLLKECSRLLSKSGKLSLIFPYEQRDEVLNLAMDNQLHLNRELLIKPSDNKPIKRILIELSRDKKVSTDSDLIVIESGGRHQYSQEYIDLTSAFYLKF